MSNSILLFSSAVISSSLDRINRCYCDQTHHNDLLKHVGRLSSCLTQLSAQFIVLILQSAVSFQQFSHVLRALWPATGATIMAFCCMGDVYPGCIYLVSYLDPEVHWESCLTQRAPEQLLHVHGVASPAALGPTPGYHWKHLKHALIFCKLNHSMKNCNTSNLSADDNEGHHPFLHLLFQAVHFCSSGVDVDNWFIFNLASSVSISQRVDGFLHVGVCRTDASNHQSVAVASQRIWGQTHRYICNR